MRILILEDNEDRRLAMADRLQDRFAGYDVEFFAAAEPMIQRIEAASLDDVVLICLDHDLELLPGDHGDQLLAPGTGVDVASRLAHHSAICPIVLHTTNTDGGDQMRDVLTAANWTVMRVVPFGDLDWIDDKWFPTVRNAIVSHTPDRFSARIGADEKSD